ncbi:GSCOCG00009859001-RA-CDS [Cotesia congregata]|uniref:Uncharacterized protein n=1 Tax=Cotesia congregata TaxID=51543 RepID=A0A8J2ML72_COTCN|nr:GSCOCG00009859001-RA-CDS [Cotesia congregata]CAG5093431.1 Protein of unknown function [Cotesia congregata]
MESLNDILSNLSEFKNNQHVIINEENNLQISDINDHFDGAKNLIDMSENKSERTNDALISIESYEHGIQKISDSHNEIKLPISHIEHNATTGFITDTMTFVNYLDMDTNTKSNINLIPPRISTWVQRCIQDLKKDIRNCKFITDNVEVMINNFNIFENSSVTLLDTSINENLFLESIQE